MKTPCPIVFSAEDFHITNAFGADELAAEQANALAAAQWQAYVEGLTEVFGEELHDGTVWSPRRTKYETLVTRILPPEEIK